MKRERNVKICVECGRQFGCPRSDKTVTCSAACRSEHARKRQTGKKRSKETCLKISMAARGRDMAELQQTGTQAAKNSPNSGRFESNVNAKDWYLVSPEGKHYHFHSLNFWLRENCRELFGCEPDSRQFNNVRSGLAGAKRGAMGKGPKCCTYKGWQALPTDSDYN